MPQSDFARLRTTRPGQVWRTAAGGLYEIAADAVTLPLDLVELVRDEAGFTIWRGGEQPEETIGKMVECRARGFGGRIRQSHATHLRWSHVGNGTDIVAYKIIEEVAGESDGFKSWGGGEQPEETRGKTTYVRFRSPGNLSVAPGSIVDALDWSHAGSPGDIIAYKVAEDAASEDMGTSKAITEWSDINISVDSGEQGDDRAFISVEIPPGYEGLFSVLLSAFEQASRGKGAERHGGCGVPFEEQPMATINRTLGSVDGFLYQAAKKAAESRRLPDGRAQAELLGAINYLAGAVIAYDTWAKKTSPES